jgi:hypothetical protein
VVSQENVERIRGLYDRWTRDREIDREAFDPEFEISTPMTRLESRTRRGYEGYKAWRAATSDVASDDWFEPDEFVDLDGQVLVTGWFHLKGRASGAESRDRAVQLWTFKQGKPSSMTLARTLEEAIEARPPE